MARSSTAQAARVRSLQAQGLTDVAIATRLQIGLTTVRRALGSQRTAPPAPRRPPPRRNIASLHGPSPIDVQVGRQVRLYRTVAGLSQTQLADAIGLTFQQVQKYERGSNRISASKLMRVAEVLGVSVSAFFEGIDDGRPPADEPIMLRREAIELSRAYERIASPDLRSGLMELFENLGEQLLKKPRPGGSLRGQSSTRANARAPEKASR